MPKKPVNQSPKAKKHKRQLTETQKLEKALAKADPFEQRSDAIGDIVWYIKQNKNGGTFQLDKYDLEGDEMDLLTQALSFRLLQGEEYKPIKITPSRISEKALQIHAEKQRRFAEEADKKLQELQARETLHQVAEVKKQPSIDALLADGETSASIAKKFYQRILAVSRDDLIIHKHGSFISLSFPAKSTPERAAIVNELQHVGVKVQENMTLDESQLEHFIHKFRTKLPVIGSGSVQIVKQLSPVSDTQSPTRLKWDEYKKRMAQETAEWVAQREKDAQELAKREKEREKEIREFRELKARQEERFQLSGLEDEARERKAQKAAEKLAAERDEKSRRVSIVALSVPLSPVKAQIERWEQRRRHDERVAEKRDSIETARSKRTSQDDSDTLGSGRRFS